MRGAWALLGAAVLVGAGCASAPPAPTEEEMNAAWMKAMNPGEPHARMARHCGDWDVAGRMWMAPGAPPTESTGVAKIRMVLGGRYQIQEYEGAFMGMTFQGMGVAGYDNVRQVYFSSWFDSMGTGVMNSEGNPDASGAIVYLGEMPDPLGNSYRMREVLTEKGPDTILFEMYMQGLQWPEEGKMMELLYTRKK